MIIDASVLLSAFFPDEAQEQAQAVLRQHAAGKERLKAPTLIVYEVTNAVWQAERRGRITSAQAEEILQAASGLDIELLPFRWGESLTLARKFNISAYDAAYLTLTEGLDEKMVTADERLYNAVHSKLKWVLWLREYVDSNRPSITTEHDPLFHSHENCCPCRRSRWRETRARTRPSSASRRPDRHRQHGR